jgi:hypothetical protein
MSGSCSCKLAPLIYWWPEVSQSAILVCTFSWSCRLCRPLLDCK